MKPAAKKVVDAAASVLNRHLASQTTVGQVLAEGGETAEQITNLVNEILKEAADGARLVTAVETSGELLGFVSRSQVPIPEAPKHESPPPSPEDL